MELVGCLVNHKKWGEGVITQFKTDRGYQFVFVRFSSGKEIQFQYPIVFEGILSLSDAAANKALLAEIEEEKAAALAEKAAKEAEEKLRRQKEIESQETTSAIKSAKSSPSKAYVPRQRKLSEPFTFFVFQNKTFETEASGGYLWAPKNEDGRVVHHWDRLVELRKGDVVFSGADSYIKSVNHVTDCCKDCERPESLAPEWERDGRMAPLEYYLLKNPVRIGDYKEEILKYSNAKYGPFNHKGNGNEGYLFELDPNLARFFLEKVLDSNPDMGDLPFLQFLID